MPRTTKKLTLKPEGKAVAEQLDALNARTQAARNASTRRRRMMEGTIEARARRRRSAEGPATAGFKRAV